jgi:hypothetical protein
MPDAQCLEDMKPSRKVPDNTYYRKLLAKALLVPTPTIAGPALSARANSSYLTGVREQSSDPACLLSHETSLEKPVISRD